MTSLPPDLRAALDQFDGEASGIVMCSGLHSSAVGLALIAKLGARFVRLSGAAGSRSVILGSGSVRRT